MARQALGKGLNALIPGHLRDLDADPKAGPAQDIAIAEVKPNPWQPRRDFDPAELQALADSIQAQGVLQPVLVVKAPGGGFTLVSGERRLRAVQRLGWTRIPAVVRASAEPREMAEWALVENVQRDDLDPMEQARAYQRLVEEFKLTQEEVAARVGRERSSVANTLRLLRLPAEVQALLEKGELHMGHARALLALSSPQAQRTIAARAAREGWSVRAVEAAGQERARSVGGKRRAAPAASPELQALEDRLRRKLGTKVKLLPAGKGGRIEVHYYSAEELERLLELLG